MREELAGVFMVGTLLSEAPKLTRRTVSPCQTKANLCAATRRWACASLEISPQAPEPPPERKLIRAVSNPEKAQHARFFRKPPPTGQQKGSIRERSGGGKQRVEIFITKEANRFRRAG
jgi:hypothetical protein